MNTQRSLVSPGARGSQQQRLRLTGYVWILSDSPGLLREKGPTAPPEPVRKLRIRRGAEPDSNSLSSGHAPASLVWSAALPSTIRPPETPTGQQPELWVTLL